MKIARVFPTKTSLSPLDWDAYFNPPDLFTPQYDEIHISVTFTWDIKKAELLRCEWEKIAPVKIGGVAIDGESQDEFVPGRYIAKGGVITSRGCPDRCPWCIVKDRPLKELSIHEGNNILDNNILACSKSHVDKVFQMLLKQHTIQFSGGLEAARITDDTVEKLRGIRIYQMFLAYDHESRRKDLIRAAGLLKPYFNRDKIRCFVLIGFGNDTLDVAEERLREAWDIGTLPFAMLYRGPGGEFPEPVREWKQLQRTWSRPAATKTLMNSKQG